MTNPEKLKKQKLDDKGDARVDISKIYGFFKGKN